MLAIAVLSFILQLLTLQPPNVIGEPYFIAQNIIKGLGFAYAYPYPAPPAVVPSVTCYIPPLFVYFLTAVLKLGGTMVTIQVINLLFLQAASFTLYKFAKKFTSVGVALIAYTLISFYLPNWLLAAAVEPNALNLLLLALTVKLLYDTYQEPTTKRWLLLGLLSGAQTLVRPDMLLGAVCFAAWMLLSLHKRGMTSAAVRGVLQAAAVALLLIMPWTVRNYLAFHKFVLVSANSGYNFYLGNNPGATGGFEQDTTKQGVREDFEQIQSFSIAHSQVETDHYVFHLGLVWASQHPVDLVLLDLKKIFYHWWRRGRSGTMVQHPELMPMYDIASALVLFFGFWGFFRLRDRELRRLFATLFIYSTLTAAIFFTQSRHRALKVDPFLLPLAALAIGHLIAKRRTGSIDYPEPFTSTTSVAQQRTSIQQQSQPELVP